MGKALTLAIVTATTDKARARPCLHSWATTAEILPHLTVVENGGKARYLGSVPAFRQGVDRALQESDADVIACFHDDLEILELDWDAKVLRYFEREPSIGLAGFGGAIGLGTDAIYHAPYDPMQLARIGFRSNLVDAEAHGARSLLAERVACLDGFSQIGRRAFWEGRMGPRGKSAPNRHHAKPWTELQDLGIIHHGYDGMLGCLAARSGWECWYLPVRAKHYGGRTAVGDPGYAAWAQTQAANGDQGLWREAHRIWYDSFRDVLPLRV